MPSYSSNAPRPKLRDILVNLSQSPSLSNALLAKLLFGGEQDQQTISGRLHQPGLVVPTIDKEFATRWDAEFPEPDAASNTAIGGVGGLRMGLQTLMGQLVGITDILNSKSSDKMEKLKQYDTLIGIDCQKFEARRQEIRKQLTDSVMEQTRTYHAALSLLDNIKFAFVCPSDDQDVAVSYNIPSAAKSAPWCQPGAAYGPCYPGGPVYPPWCVPWWWSYPPCDWVPAPQPVQTPPTHRTDEPPVREVPADPPDTTATEAGTPPTPPPDPPGRLSVPQYTRGPWRWPYIWPPHWGPPGPLPEEMPNVDPGQVYQLNQTPWQFFPPGSQPWQMQPWQMYQSAPMQAQSERVEAPAGRPTGRMQAVRKLGAGRKKAAAPKKASRKSGP